MNKEILASDPNAKEIFRNAYLNKGDLMGSGYGGTEEQWEHCRKIISEPIDIDGSFLDLGCANGRLLFDIQKWAKEKGYAIDVYGVDFVSELVEEARKRFPGLENHFQIADVNDYIPDRTFTYIRTELAYFFKHEESSIKRYYNALEEGGKLIITKYWSNLSDELYEELERRVRQFNLGELQLLRTECSAMAIVQKP